ncbi:MAG TPA: hypothetical protein VIF62_06115, partial [Labilithrix sp.]
ILALADRPWRNAITASLVERLRRIVKLRPSGDIDAPADRAARAIVYAALLRAEKFGTTTASAPTLAGRIAILRDVGGGYGSSSATLSVVRALLASQLEGHGTTRVHVRAHGYERDVNVAESAVVSVPLPADALSVEVETEGPGVVARFERPVLRMWSRPPPAQESPVGIEVVWPADAHADGVGTLRVMLRHSLYDAHDIDARIPMPPGATLAAPTQGASQLQGAIFIRQSVDRGEAVIEIPIRFALALRATVPEATARLARSPAPAAVAPSRALVVQPR